MRPAMAAGERPPDVLEPTLVGAVVLIEADGVSERESFVTMPWMFVTVILKEKNIII